MDDKKGYLTMRQLRARYGDCSRNTIYRRMADAGYPQPEHFGTKGAKLLWPEDEVEEWDHIHLRNSQPRRVRAESDVDAEARAKLRGYVPRRQHPVKAPASRTSTRANRPKSKTKKRRR